MHGKNRFFTFDLFTNILRCLLVTIELLFYLITDHRPFKRTMSTSVLKYLKSENSEYVDQNVEMPPRAKKRRLDHLSWEEKMQRK